MFSDESCSCSDDEKMKSLPVHISERRGGGGGGERSCCNFAPILPMRGHSMRESREERREEESSGCCSSSPIPNHYKSPKDVDGDYSYAYSDSVSPAFLIRVGAQMEYSGSGEEEEDEGKENIYEEIREKSEENQQYQSDSRKSSTSSHEVSTTSSTKSRFQKALEAVTRRSSRSLEHGDRDRSFHLSISKGRKKSLIDRAHVDWDCPPETGGMKSRLNKSHSDMLEEVSASHTRVMSQLKLDVEDMLMPPPSPPGDETQDDSGFHSGGMSSSTSTEEQQAKTKKKSIIKTTKSTKRSESQPGRMNRCESIDLKEMQQSERKKSCEVFRTRSKIIADHHHHHQGLYGHYGHLPAHGIYAVHPPPPVMLQKSAKQSTLGKSYLSKLVSLPFLGTSRQQAPVYGKNNNNIPQTFGEEQGRTFYL